MPALLGRAVLLLLSSATLLGGAWAFWTQSGTYPVDHPALYACSLAPLVLAVIALVNVFVPFDRPASAPRWSAPMVGLALGLTAGGLVMYTASFVWLGPLLVVYAVLLWTAAAAIARGVGERLATLSPSEEALIDGEIDETLSVGPPGRPGTRARDALVVLSAAAGVGLCWTWSPPPGGARALPLGLEVAPVLSSQAPHLRLVRVVRRERAVELSGNRIEVTLSLERPHVEVLLRKQRIVLEPALQLEEATADGFFSVPWVNGYAAEPGGPGEVELAEGPDIGWVRVTYPTLRVVHRGPLAPMLGAWGRPPGDAMSTRLDLAVDLKQGRVRVDALTSVPRPLTVRRTSLGRVRLTDAGAARLRFGLGSGLDAEPPEGRPGTTPTPAELLVTDDGEVVRALRARRRDEGPFDTVEAGPWADWFTVEGLRDRFLVVAPDWERQASRAPSRTAGHGLPENALVYWREQGTLSVVTDVAGTRVGPGRLSTELPAGLYRHRVALMALDRGESAATRAASERLRLVGPNPDRP